MYGIYIYICIYLKETAYVYIDILHIEDAVYIYTYIHISKISKANPS